MPSRRSTSISADTFSRLFENEKRGSRTGPYTSNPNELSYASVQRLIKNAIKQTGRYRNMKAAGYSEEEIDKVFHTKYEMDVFAYVKETKMEHGKSVTRIVPGTKSVTMTPYDSLMYMKTILRTGLMSMDPVTGYVKAYVGGPDFTHFQYDMVARESVRSVQLPSRSSTLWLSSRITPPAPHCPTLSRYMATGHLETRQKPYRRQCRPSLGTYKLEQLDFSTTRA